MPEVFVTEYRLSDSKTKKQTYNTRYSLVVTDPTTNPGVECRRSCEVTPAFPDDPIIKFVILVPWC